MSFTDTTLLRNVIATITYYDVLDFPMTSFEVWRHMIVAPSRNSQVKQWRLDEVISILETTEAQTYLIQKNGFYILHGRVSLIRERRKRELISVTKMMKLNRYVHLLRITPFVRMIALTGRLSYKNGEESSDLDVLVACKKGHIWTGRFLMTFMTQIMGVRRYGKHHADRVCLNYYITDETLEVPTKDLYAAHEYSFIVALFGFETFENFIMANRWIKEYKPHYFTTSCKSDLCVSHNSVTKFLQKSGEFFWKFSWIEKKLKAFQYKKIMDNPKSRYENAVIIATDEHLVFLPKPHGPRVFEEYKKRFEALEIPWS